MRLTLRGMTGISPWNSHHASSEIIPNGLTGGFPPRVLNHAPVLRGDCKGWTLRSSRGNTRFLYSVLTPELPVSAIGVPLLGLSGSLTLRDCPPSHDDWKTLREALFFRLRRKVCIACIG